MRKILGIDPGSRKAGFALISYNETKIKLLDSGVLIYDHKIDFIDRLGIIYNTFKELALKHDPQEIALESLIYVKNVSSLAKLAQARGAMIAAFPPGNLFEYSPTKVKAALTSYGHAGKTSVQKSLTMMFGPIDFKSDDESDALAIAVCHVFNRPYDCTTAR
ncbi:MAG: crossover junction endodeoxyribonuclease RuvC [Epsilonproteobacteria bacterium]|nr:MAG: crossover junction endodeoxyribonuclease RuvC [Campylobacterota bacterium]RLA63285.1 MAG: crossover junction endodeoxyribonuclease RuvC [Campylobacterota bacterium]